MDQKKTIGIIGGISPMSTAVYYSRMATEFNDLMGGLNYPRLILSSVNMADIRKAHESKDFHAALRIFNRACMDMASADFILVASNTMHCVVDGLKEILDRDILDIRAVVAEAVQEKDFRKVLLLGSQDTMKEDFFKKYLHDKGIEVVVPAEAEQQQLNSMIYDKLCRGDDSAECNELVQKIVADIAAKDDVDAVILACTEFSLLKQNYCIPALDSTELHVKAAVRRALDL